ncbi:MAG: AAA family ATPase [Marvinbryantia sp.]|uniref:AAA family ATPase n=1 Tax=Marvinbryantia sp. TaxID=2496532 RepID=UPI0025CE3207|nr:AAA family ATPase [uncultured Marvinbryantia sp.]
MEHYITEIKIEKLRHLSDITIPLDPEKRQHLMITGKNGSGKTSLLLALQKYLNAINKGELTKLESEYVKWLRDSEKKLRQAKTEAERFEAEKEYQRWFEWVKKFKDGIEVTFNNAEALDALYAQGRFITAFFPANRKTQIIRARGVEDIRLSDAYDIYSQPGQFLHKYMVHLKTQQAYARNEGDMTNADRIQKWFDRFVKALRVLLDDDTLTLEYDYKEYDFKIHEDGRNPFGFDELSDGYSSVIHIVSDLILRMDRNWLLGDGLSEYDAEGIVLIDELETHLHIELQKKILPFLTEFFPRIQFIVTTHSPYILNSVSNAKAYDLERCVELEDLFMYSSEGLADGYFEADEYGEELKSKIDRYGYLAKKVDLTEEERAERAKLRIELKNIPRGLSQEAWEKFEEIEGGRL